MWGTRYSCQILIKPEFFDVRIFEKHTNIKFSEYRAEEAELFHAEGQADRLDEANSRFSKFCEPA
jgi:hypothetical protein